MIPYRNFVAGALEESERSFEVRSPFDGTCVGRQGIATPDQAARALQAARDAAVVARAATPAQRAGWLHGIATAVDAHAGELRDLVMRELGIPQAVAMAPFASFYTEAVQRKFGELVPDHQNRALHACTLEPVGVVVSFTAFNYPAAQLCFRMAAAIATGNAVVLKASERTPLVAARIGELLAGLDLPRGLVSILVGDPVDPGALMTALAGSSIPRLVTLIGSTAGGLAVLRAGATSIKRYELELGGNAPVVLFEDAGDMLTLADSLINTKLANAGQVCVSPNRVYVHRTHHAALLERCCARMKDMRPSTSPDAADGYFPVISAAAVARLEDLVADARAKGATVLCGGSRLEGLGNFFRPTLLDGVGPGMRVHDEEIFGPILGIRAFDDGDDVLALANDTAGALTAYVFTRDLDRALRAQQQLRYGSVHVNQLGLWAPYLPHGGLDQSGLGKNHGHQALDSYFDIKRTSIALPKGSLP